ncbi:MAG: Smr/MutS family protein, partial [Bacteroidales bacterium]|nr:Smr/MutS family protein [Bacteroidales bacterium]
GRLVIPVPPAYKRRISGIVHDESASGKTVFIEPAELVEANNQIRELQSEEKREIIRILTQFADFIRPQNEELLSAFDYMAQIDFIRAKALLATKINALKPQLSEKSLLNWNQAIHPLLFLSLKKHGKEVVPLDIQLDEQQRILVISGPNAGGKSVCLKTVGLLQYMLQCGLLIPLREDSVCGIFSRLYIDIGDEQSIENDLSTYSSHLTNIKFFLKNSDKKTLLLIDEFGSGTEPKIGGAIAEACLGLFKQKGIFGVITTHYDNLKHFAEDNDGVINGAMLYDRHLMQPLFRLETGRPGSSFAVEIARTIGLPQEVIDKAGELVGSDYIDMDKYLQDVARDKRYWGKKRLEIKRLEKDLAQLTSDYQEQMELIKQERKLILNKAKTQAEQLLSQANAEIESTIKSIRESQAEKEQTKQLRANLDKFKQQTLREEQEAAHPLKSKTRQASARKQKILSKLQTKIPVKAVADTKICFIPGDTVHLKNQNVAGKVLEVKGQKVTVVFGNIKSILSPDQLEKGKTPKNKELPDKSLGLKLSEEVHRIGMNFKQEIDLRGLRGDEALQQVMYYIDEAIVVGVSKVRLLHGTGTGVLRILIRNYLGTVPEVKSFRDEHIQLGGAGITVVEFKQ